MLFILLHNCQLITQACYLHPQGRIHVEVNKRTLIALLIVQTIIGLHVVSQEKIT